MSTRNLLANVDLSGVKRDYTWYTVATMMNCEESYVRNLKDAFRGSFLSDYIEEYYIPMQYIKKDDKIKKLRGDYSGYVFVKCILTARVWHILRTTQGVAVVLTAGGVPVEVDDAAIETIRKQCSPQGLTDAEIQKLEASLAKEFKFSVQKPTLDDSDFNTDFTA